MRYAIFVEDELDNKIALVLKAEIERFDIRAEIVIEWYSYNLNLNELNTIICIGNKPYKYNYSSSIPYYFLYQSYKRARSRYNPIQLRSNVTILNDLPISSSRNVVKGNLLFDWFRRLTCTEPIDEMSLIAIIPPILQKSSKTEKLETRLKSKFKKFSIRLFNKKNFIENPQKIKDANAAIVYCSFGEMAAIHWNIPYLRITRKSFFLSEEESLVNSIAKKKILKEYGIKDLDKIVNEIDQILTNHQYCASIINEFQKIKEPLSRPIIRNLAQEIVDSLDQ